MAANSFGNNFVITTFGESHGPALGAVIDGCPAGVHFDMSLLRKWLERRRPGQHTQNEMQVVSSRNEADIPEVLSGVFEDTTLGTPIAIVVRNRDQRSDDYKQIQNAPRMGHADDMWLGKFGIHDFRGGGRSSGRETVSRVMAGAVANMIFQQIHPSLEIKGFVQQLGPFELTQDEITEARAKTRDEIDKYVGRFPSLKNDKLEQFLLKAKENGQSYGGVVGIVVRNVPPYLGQPVFKKLKSDLCQAFMSVGSSCFVELVGGFEATKCEGSQFHSLQSVEQYSGIRGGISTGEDIQIRVGFKPPASVGEIAKKGRHDPCILPRVIPVLEAMTYLVLVDHYLWHQRDQISCL